MLAWGLLLAFLTSFSLTAILRRYALRRQLMDVPNARSSHRVPTPRGGGMAIVVTLALAVGVLASLGLVAHSLALAMLGSGLMVALIGFVDDHGHIAARWRLLGHFAAAGWALFWLGGLPAIPALGWNLQPGWLAQVIALLFLVWMLNLYNFMDGIDGIASFEALCACVGALACYAAVEGVGAIGRMEWLMLAAVAGFACWNFPRARIFMGDAGSGFLGITLAVLAVRAAWVEPLLLWSWLILLGVFIVDATFTLLRRLLRGEAVYQAHRSHAYQSAARRWGHVRVTLAVALITLSWLQPWAIGVAAGLVDGGVALVVAYLPLVGLCVWLNAGAAERC